MEGFVILDRPEGLMVLHSLASSPPLANKAAYRKAVDNSSMKVWGAASMGGRGEAVGPGKEIVGPPVGVLVMDGDGEHTKVPEVVKA